MTVLKEAPTRRFALLATLAVSAVGLVASGLLVWHASYSAFSATTATPTNNWSAGSVAVNNDAGSAMFNASNLKPGATGTTCIVVTSNASLPSTVKLYATPSTFTQTKTLADNITLKVTQGTSNSSNGDCAGFVADTGASASFTGSLSSFASTYTGFSSGFGSWAPSSGTGVAKTYQFTYTLNNAATQALTDAMQGGSAALGFTWEEQNN